MQNASAFSLSVRRALAGVIVTRANRVHGLHVSNVKIPTRYQQILMQVCPTAPYTTDEFGSGIYAHRSPYR